MFAALPLRNGKELIEAVSERKRSDFMTASAASEAKNRWLKEKMEALDIQGKDIQEIFVQSSGGKMTRRQQDIGLCISQAYSHRGGGKMHERQESVRQGVSRTAGAPGKNRGIFRSSDQR